MSELHQILALSHVGECPDPGKAPETLYLTLSQLRINNAYQRTMTKASQAGIRRMAKNWDWARYTPISVAPAGDDPDVYEIPDGQRRAIAAACNGYIHILPCYLMPAETLEEKAAGFVGVNQGRVGLTTANVYKGLLVARDETAIAVQAALDANDCRILDMPPAKGRYRGGETMAVGTLMTIARVRGQGRLTTLVEMCRAADCVPISSKMLKALNLALPLDEKLSEKFKPALVRVVKGQGAARLELIANSRTSAGGRDYETLADMLADMAKLPGHRLGLPSRSKPGWKPRERPKAETPAPAPVVQLATKRGPGRPRKAA